ncbi:Endoglucanase [Lachnellula occidentalis]|uniref:Endoglucanase n=1 Tax=Lachnellula occidentalis TaxID=215460 RepID=A0A8H8U546_9HELO|nr:Endoglucanase [Lachnellula occidentalis]
MASLYSTAFPARNDHNLCVSSAPLIEIDPGKWSAASGLAGLGLRGTMSERHENLSSPLHPRRLHLIYSRPKRPGYHNSNVLPTSKTPTELIVANSAITTDRKAHVAAVPQQETPCSPGKSVILPPSPPPPTINQLTPLPSLQSNISTGIYTAAVSQALYDTSGLSWCGSGCGICYRLTSTGSAPCSSCGAGGASGQSIIVMATNLCPNSGNAQWCASPGGTNQYGFEYNFDVMAQSEVLGDNPVVDFEVVDCPGAAATDFAQCQCA